MRVEADIVDFCDAVAVEAASGDWAREDTTYTSAWLLASAAAAEAVAELTGGSVPTELDVARMITEETPRAGTVVVGNSMPVRDLDTHRNVQAELPMVVANRGASGIDGTLAAAAGVAFGAGSGTTVVLGDQAFLHDLNSLALVRKSPTPIIVVVINNDGGAIFSFLPVAEQEDLLESLFVAPHGLTFGDAARLFDLSYTRVESMSGIREAYRAAVRAGDTTVIEVPSDRERNRTIHLEIEAAVRERVTRALRSGKRDTIGEKNT